MDNNCVRYHSHPSYLWKVTVRKKKIAMCKLWPWLWQYDTESRSRYDYVIYYQDQTWQWGVMARTRFHGPDKIFRYMCTVILTLEIGPCHDTPLGHEQRLCEILSRSNMAARSYYWPGHRFWVHVYCDLDVGDMTLGQGYDTPLGHGQ